jgi:hypothetical protein
LLDAPSVETTNSFQNTTDDELGSDIDSDFGLDHKAIQHLIQDIADDRFENDGSPLMDFKPIPRTKKLGSSTKGKTRKKSKKMSFKMKGIFWNSNGLRDQAKPRFLFDSMKEYSLDFLAVLDTKRLFF